MKSIVLNQWNFFRLFRLIVGIIAVVQGITQGEWLLIIAGGFFSAMALANKGCCGTSSCAVNTNQFQTKRTESKHEELDSTK